MARKLNKVIKPRQITIDRTIKEGPNAKRIKLLENDFNQASAATSKGLTVLNSGIEDLNKRVYQDLRVLNQALAFLTNKVNNAEDLTKSVEYIKNMQKTHIEASSIRLKEMKSANDKLQTELGLSFNLYANRVDEMREQLNEQIRHTQSLKSHLDRIQKEATHNTDLMMSYIGRGFFRRLFNLKPKVKKTNG